MTSVYDVAARHHLPTFSSVSVAVINDLPSPEWEDPDTGTIHKSEPRFMVTVTGTYGGQSYSISSRECPEDLIFFSIEGGCYMLADGAGCVEEWQK